MLKKYDLAAALEKVTWEGLDDVNEDPIDGLSKMLDRIRSFKNTLLDTYSLDHVMDTTRNAIHLICTEQLESS
jgi:hypothetical protein